VHIRQAHATDASTIEDIVERAYSRYIQRIGRRPGPMDDDYAERIRRGQAFVAEDGLVTGLIILIGESDHVLIENVAVDPRHQGEGIGRALLDYAETSARALGTSELRLYTNATMTENLALYTRLGYQEVERRTDKGFERVFVSKCL
jgi:ribosomal protein S18 acetylase RimI-like enzyme